jgi:hypothetical protein
MRLRPVLSTVGLCAALLGVALLPGIARAETTHAVVKTEPKLAVGQTDKASVTIEGKNGWHLNKDAPVTLTLTPDPGLELTKAKLARADLAVSTPEQIRFDVPIAAREAGSKKVVGEARFVMCQAEACKPEKETVTLALEIAPAVAPKAAGAAHKAKAGKPHHEVTK